LIDGNCEGCPYHVYPYTAQSPVMENGKYITKEFRSDEDVWAVIDLIIEETNTVNKKQKKSFDVAKSVLTQIPFFACVNKVLDQQVQNDIARYVYCEKFKVPAYNGSYGNQPYKWIQKTNLISNAVARRQDSELKKVEKANE